MDTEISHQLFNRLEDNNWDTICLICCGLKPFEEFPENHKQVFDALNVLNDKKLTKYLIRYFSIAIDCYKNREDAIIKVFVFVSAVLHLNIKSNGNKIIGLLESEPKLKTKVLVFNKIFELLKSNFKYLSLNQTIDFKSFIKTLLKSDTNEELVYYFDLILQIDYQLFEKEDKQLKKVIKKCNPRDEDSEELFATKTHFFITLFDVFFKARKAFKLHQILSEISIDFNTNLLNFERQLSPLYGRCVLELPFGQSFDIWKLFLERFEVKNKFWIKLMPIFLEHIRYLNDCLPNHLRPQFDALLNDTKAILKTIASHLRSEDKELVHILLELYFSFESIIIIQMTYNRNYLSLEYCSQKLSSNDWFDLSVIYDFTKNNDWKQLFENLNDMTLDIIKTLIKCLFQKYEFWKIIELNVDLTEQQKSIVKTYSNELLSSIVVNFASTHLNVFTIHQINAIIKHLKRNDLSFLTDSLISNVNENKCEELEFVRRLLLNGNVWESIEFQTAFIGSFWRHFGSSFKNKKRKLNEDSDKFDKIFESLSADHSFWFKYSTLSPDMKKLNKIWSNIADISTEVQSFIEIKDKTTKKSRISLNLMELFVDFVPLEYLLPANQMRCLLSLSLILFSIDSNDENNQILIDLILNCILRIFDGVRSVWFFNFITPSVYLVNVLKILENYGNHEKIRSLMNKFVENIFRNTEEIEKLRIKLLENEDQIKFDFLVMTETIILKRSLHVLNIITVPKSLLKIREFCGPLSHHLSTSIHNQIKIRLTSESSVDSLNSIIIIDSFAAVFEFQVSKSSSDEEIINLKTKWRKLLAKLIDISVNQLKEMSANKSCVKFLAFICSQRKKLVNILPENFIMNLWHVLCPITYEQNVEIETSLKDIKLFDVLNERKNFEILLENIRLEEEINRNQFLESIFNQNLFAEVLEPLLISLFQCSSAEEFEEFLNSLIKYLKTTDYLRLSFVLKLWIRLFKSDFHLNEEKNHLFQKFISDLLILCSQLCKRCNQKENRLLMEIQMNIKLPILIIMRSVLHITKNVITSPQLFLSYHSCIDTKIELYISEPKIFSPLFEAIYSVLNESLLNHKFIVMASISSFNSIVQKLIQTLMTISDEQKFINYEPMVRHDLEICSKNMDRLLTLLASLGSDFSVYAPHLITFYVIQTESVSVHLIVKKNIISGINRLLKILSTKSIEMIYCRLNDSSRKIFKFIFDNYEKYYKFKGQI